MEIWAFEFYKRYEIANEEKIIKNRNNNIKVGNCKKTII